MINLVNQIFVQVSGEQDFRENVTYPVIGTSQKKVTKDNEQKVYEFFMVVNEHGKIKEVFPSKCRVRVKDAGNMFFMTAQVRNQ